MTDAIIHLRVPAIVKAGWVQDSRSAGMRLTDWVVHMVESSQQDSGLSDSERNCRLSADELAIARIIAGGTSRRAAEMVVALNHMPPAPTRIRPSSVFRAVVEYAKPERVASLWEQQDITPYYDECHARHGQAAGVWVGD